MSGEGPICTIEPCNNVVGSANLIDGKIDYNGYGYIVNEASAIVFVLFFGVSWIVHLIQTSFLSRPIRRNWYLYATIGVCGFGETLGWAGRLWSNLSTEWWPSLGGSWGGNDNAFMMQICCLIIAPSFFIAANYIILGRLIKFGGARYCHINPRVYTKLFIGADFFSIVIQAAGGGISSGNNISASQLKTGSNIMLAGIVFQVAVIIGFWFLLVEFTHRLYNDRPVKSHWHPFNYFLCWNRAGRKARDAAAEGVIGVPRDEWSVAEAKGVKMTLVGLYITTILILIRGTYRTAELSKGWTSKINQDQTTFCIFDGAMVCIAFYVWNVLHPGRLLPYREDDKMGSRSPHAQKEGGPLAAETL